MNLSGNSEVRQFMDQVEDSTIASQHVELPMIVVVGDRNSGKSSLLSSLSTIELPTSKKITTCCPVRLHMSKADKKQAVIGIEWKQKPSAEVQTCEELISSNATPVAVNCSTNNQSSEPQVEPSAVKEVSNSSSIPEAEFKHDLSPGSKPVARRIFSPFSFRKVEAEFQEIIVTKENWHLLPEMIIKAQKHIAEFCGDEIIQDIVTVEVSGPDYYDLTFVDLPCIVHPQEINEKRAAYNINCLYSEYLENKSCILLAAIAGNEDLCHSQVISEVLKVDPETKRTIPVITKSDFIKGGREKDAVQLLLDKTTSFKLGFHIVKCRGEDSLDQKETLKESLTAEKEFFQINDPWRSIEDRTLFGIENLRRKLGDLQMCMFRNKIPDIVKDLTEERNAAKEQLVSMGVPAKTVSEKRHVFSSLVDTMLDFMRGSLSGKRIDFSSNANASACSELRQEFARFCTNIGTSQLVKMTEIRKGTPVLVLRKGGAGEEIRGKVAAVYDTFACVHYVDEKDRNSETLFEATSEPEENDWNVGAYLEGMDTLRGHFFVYRGGGKRDQFRNIPLEEMRTDPSWLADIISTNCTEDLACFLNAEVFNRLVAKFIDDDWRSPSLDVVNKTASVLRRTYKKAFLHTRGGVQYPSLEHLLVQKFEDVLKEVTYVAKSEVEKHLNLEKVPYAQDRSLFESIAQKRNQNLYNEINHALIGEVGSGENISTNTIREVLNQVFERNQKKTVEENMAEELEMTLEAYGKVAFKRVGDKIPMICRDMTKEFLVKIKRAMQSVTDSTLEDAVQHSLAYCREREAQEIELKYIEKSLHLFKGILLKRSMLKMDSSCFYPPSKRQR